MNALTGLSISRPLTMLTIIVTISLTGILALQSLNVESLPETDLPFVAVSFAYPGGTPQDVVDNAINEIEDAIAEVGGIERITSTAYENFGVVSIQFIDGTNADQSAADLDRQLKSIQNNLPDEVQNLKVDALDLNAQAFMLIVLSGPQGADALFDLASNSIKPQMQAVPGVGKLVLSGGRDRQIHVLADPTKLSAYGVSLKTLGDTLQQENVNRSAGNRETETDSISVRSFGEFQSLDDIENLVVGSALPVAPSLTNPENSPLSQVDPGLIFMRNVAEVKEGFEDVSRLVRLNGEEGVLFSIAKASGANTVNVADGINQFIKDFESELPPGAKFTVVTDDSVFTRASLVSVAGDLGGAIIITGLVLLLFLHTIQHAGVVVFMLPIALSLTLAGVWAAGFTLNTLTLLALTVAIGSMVDDSITIVELTDRYMREGRSVRQAAFDATNDLSVTSFSTTVVSCVVYIPVALMSGTVGAFFFSYGITVVIAFIVSIFMAFTFTPLMAVWLLPDPTKPSQTRGLAKIIRFMLSPILWVWFNFVIGPFEAMFVALGNGYRFLLRLILATPVGQVLVIAVSLWAVWLGATMASSGLIPFEFQPYQDDSKITISLEMPASVSIRGTDRVVRQIEQIVRTEVPELEDVLVVVGTQSSGDDADNKFFADITLVLADKRLRERTAIDVADDLRPVLKMLAGPVNTVVFATGNNANNIDFDVFSTDADSALRLARSEILPLVKTIPGAADVRISGVQVIPQENIIIDRQRAAELGMSNSLLADTLFTTVGGAKKGTYQSPGALREVDIILRTNEESRNDLEQILQMPVGYLRGDPMRVAQIAHVEQAEVPSRITKSNRNFAFTIEVVPTGRGQADVLGDITKLLDNYNFEAGQGWQLGSATGESAESTQQIVIALVTAIILIYLVLLALYQSFLQPLAVMGAIPVVLLGAMLGLYIEGTTLNIFSMLGIVMLAGLVAKNTILMVDQYNTMRQEGTPIKEAIIEGSHLRMRAILMTAFSLIFALIPLLTNNGLGSELRAPIAAVVVYGQGVAVAFFLFLTPVLYNVLEAFGQGVSWFVHNIIGLGGSDEDSGEAPPPDATPPDGGSGKAASEPKAKPAPQPSVT